MITTTILLGITLSFMGCGDNNRDFIIVETGPRLLRFDCNEYLNRVYSDQAGRGVSESGFAKERLKDAQEWCTAGNKRRGH